MSQEDAYTHTTGDVGLVISSISQVSLLTKRANCFGGTVPAHTEGCTHRIRLPLRSVKLFEHYLLFSNTRLNSSLSFFFFFVRVWRKCWKSCHVISPRRVNLFTERVGGLRRRLLWSSLVFLLRLAGQRKHPVTEPTTSTLF